MSRFFTMSFMALGLLVNSPAFASHCSCDSKCAAECASGKAAHCVCKDCDCSKGGGCKHGKCGLPKADSK
jgi:hypothetical protein